MTGVVWLAWMGLTATPFDVSWSSRLAAAPAPRSRTASKRVWRYPFERDGRCGWLDRRGRVVIQPRRRIQRCFEQAFHSGELLPVRTSSSFWSEGYLDIHGKLRVKPRYYGAKRFAEGLAKASARRAVHYFDVRGRAVLKVPYGKAEPFSSGLAAVLARGGWGYMNRRGKLVIQGRFRRAGPFRNGRALVYRGRQPLVIDRRGRVVFGHLKPFWIAPKPGRSAWRWRRGSRRGRGSLRLGSKGFSGGILPVTSRKGCGYVDVAGRLVVKPKYGFCLPVRDGRARVRVGMRYHMLRYGRGQGRVGYLSTGGKLVVPARFQDGRDFSEGLAAVRWRKRWGFIDKQGKWVIKPRYTNALSFRGGLALVSVKGVWRYVDPQGRTRWQPAGPTPGGKRLRFRTVKRGRHSPLRLRKKRRVIRNLATWKGLWAKTRNPKRSRWHRSRRGYYRRKQDPLAAPRVDFRRNVAVIVTQGYASGRKTSIRVHAVRAHATHVEIQVRDRRSLWRCHRWRSTRSGNAYHIVTIPRPAAGRPIRFHLRTQDDCGSLGSWP